MDFFFNVFAPAITETRAELDSEVEQVPVNLDDGGGGSQSCIVA
jgi:hypothetical protein